MAPFDELKTAFWDERSDYLMQPPLTDEALRSAENALGVTLPGEYVELLRLQNGGVVAPALSIFRVGERVLPFEDMRGIGDATESILDSTWLTDEWEMPRELVLLTGDGHTWIALDHRAGGEASVVWFDNELEEDLQLAPDFRTFVSLLEPGDPTPLNPDMRPSRDYVKYFAKPLAAMIEDLRDDLALLGAGERTLKATRAWLAMRPREAVERLPRRETGDLRRAIRRLRRAGATDLPPIVDEIIAELEALLPRWLELGDTTARRYDERYADEHGLR